MQKLKRSYYLPIKLVDNFDQECSKSGFVRERVVAAAVHHFMKCTANERHAMFMNLDSFLKKRGK